MTTAPLRRRLAAALPVAGLLALAACSNAADLPAETTASQGEGALRPLTVAVLPIGDLGAYFYAEANGIFEEHGLDVTTEFAAGGSAAIAAMAAGDYDIVYSGADGVIKAYANDIPVQIISGANNNQPENQADATGLVVAAGITEVGALQGGALGTNALGNINQVYAQEFLAKNGVTDVEVVEIPFPEQVAALEAGQIQATLLPEPFASQAVAGGASILGFPYRIGQDETTAVGVYVSTDTFIEENPEAIDVFVGAMAEASEAANDPANRDAVVAAILSNTQLSQDVATGLTFVQFTTEVTAERIQATADLLVKYGVLTEKVDASGIIAK
ncbi:MAG: ABC transporter substrate-binding protein [Bifidobacteriaceae bacterium]|jgi:NitT/TauT family transport system substrate-binding protein|nr:ABC transporter substrate-binding protein [Bifidobacteriaceae bacterium]